MEGGSFSSTIIEDASTLYADNAASLGEVSGNTIIIYDEDIESAESTLIHEFCEYQFDKVTRPLIQYINNQNKLIEILTYQLREDVVNCSDTASLTGYSTLRRT